MLKSVKLCLVGVALVTFSGCAGGGVSPEVSPGVALSSTASVAVGQSVAPASASISGPLEDASMGGVDFVTSEAAQIRAIQSYIEKCMTTEGFRYVAEVPNLEEIRLTRLEMAYGTFLADESYRKKRGYGVTGWLVGVSPAEEPPVDNSLTKGMSKSELAAYDKALEECAVAAHKNALPGDLIDQVFALMLSDLPRAKDDKEVLAAVGKWNECMVAEGYVVKSMEYASRELEEQSREVAIGSDAAKRLYKEELRQAEVDWQCRVQHYNDVYFRVRDRIENEFIERNVEVVNKLRDATKKIVSE